MLRHLKTQTVCMLRFQPHVKALKKCIIGDHVGIYVENPIGHDLVHRLITRGREAFICIEPEKPKWRFAAVWYAERKRLGRSVVDHQHFDKRETTKFGCHFAPDRWRIIGADNGGDVHSDETTGSSDGLGKVAAPRVFKWTKFNLHAASTMKNAMMAAPRRTLRRLTGLFPNHSPSDT